MALDFIRTMDKGMKYISKQGGFLTSKADDQVNTTTISWATIGYMWGKPVLIVMVRKSRYIHEIMNKAKSFTLSVPTNSEKKKALGICGSKSGKNVDKYQLAGITLIDSESVDSPRIADCGVYFECKTIYSHEFDPMRMKGDSQDPWYQNEDFHTAYYGEIVNYYIE